MKTIKNKKIFKDKLRNEWWNEKKGGEWSGKCKEEEEEEEVTSFNIYMNSEGGELNPNL